MDEKNADASAVNPFADARVIFSYTRAQAIEDGVLVDLTPWGEGDRVPHPGGLYVSGMARVPRAAEGTGRIRPTRTRSGS